MSMLFILLLMADVAGVPVCGACPRIDARWARRMRSCRHACRRTCNFRAAPCVIQALAVCAAMLSGMTGAYSAGFSASA